MGDGDTLYRNAVGSLRTGKAAESRNDFPTADKYYYLSYEQFESAALAYDRIGDTPAANKSRRQHVSVMRDRVRVSARISQLEDDKAESARVHAEESSARITAMFQTELRRLTPNELRMFVQGKTDIELAGVDAALDSYTKELAAYLQLARRATSARSTLFTAQNILAAAEARVAKDSPAEQVA